MRRCQQPCRVLHGHRAGPAGTRAASLVLVLALAGFLLCAPASAAGSGRAVSFAAADGTALAGLLYEAPVRPAPAVVLVHMLGRSKDEWAPFADRLQESGITALAFDLRGHGHSAGNGSELTAMIGDVRAAIAWLSARPGVRPGALGAVGASLGANLAALAVVDAPAVRALALVSPSLDYRGVRLDPQVLRKPPERARWMAASLQDPYARRSLRELAGEDSAIEQRLSSVRAHGTPLLAADQELARALLDWLKARLIF